MTTDEHAAPITAWTVDGIPHDAKRPLERIARSDDVVRIAVLPDVHVAGATCVGCSVATTRLVYPALVGQDIGCGIATIAFDGDASSLMPQARGLLEALLESVPIIRHRGAPDTNRIDGLPDLGGLSHATLRTVAQREGAIQLGTLGRGNHFLEFQSGDDDRLWLMVHSGSRVMGERITSLHTAQAAKRRGGLVALDIDEGLGQAYLNDMAWAVEYARTNRRAMLDAVARVIERRFGVAPDDSSYMDCDHNHVQVESMDGERLLVHRKGANRAHADVVGLIPGAMGRESFHVRGRGVVGSLCSSSHGAGRVMSRGKARYAIDRRTLARALEHVAVAPSIAHRLTEEAPEAYRGIHAVMRAQRDLVRVVRAVRGFVVHKGVD